MAGLLDPDFDPSLIDGSGLPLDLPSPAKPAGSKWKELAPLLAVLPLALKQGGRVGAAHLLQGFQQSRQQASTQDRQSQLDAQNQAYRQAVLSGQHDQRVATAENAETQRRQQFIDKFTAGIGRLDQESADADAYQKYYELQALQGDTLGVPRAQLEGLVPTAASLNKKKAQKELEKLQKARPDDWQNWSVTIDGQPVRATDLTGIVRNPDAPAVAPKDDNDPLDRRYLGASIQQFREANKREPTPQEMLALITGAKKAVGQADDRPRITINNADKPLTQNQRANIIGTRRNQWQRFAKAVNDRQLAVAKVDAGVAALDRGNRNAATQAIIMAFNKLLDETSVVREGEYARSEQLVPLTNRIEGALQRITMGGASMKDSDLRALASEAKQIAQGLQGVSDEAARTLRESIELELGDYKIPTDRVFGGSTIGATQAPKAPSAPQSGPPVSYQDYLKSRGGQ